MKISAQYLEGGTDAAQVSPRAARSRLHEALQRVPLDMVLLGWDLDARVVEACAHECTRHGCDLYLWYPVLTGHGRLSVDPKWRVLGLSGEPVAGLDGKPEFTFMCPNREEARHAVLLNMSEALAGGHYQGVFLDRIRFPSPAADLGRDFGCFCDACRVAALESGLDLMAAREDLVQMLREPEGPHTATASMLSPKAAQANEDEPAPFKRLLEFRERSVSLLVREIAEILRARGLKVGLDCFSPTIARMVGQDLQALSQNADWIKVMTYGRLFAPASLAYEVSGLANWLSSSDADSEARALDFLSRIMEWTLPDSREAMQRDGLPAAVLTQELHRGRSANPRQLLAGIELVEGPKLGPLSPRQMRADADAVRLGAPDGVVLSWDLWRIPPERLELAASLYGDAAAT
jgi:hypothetical protein